MLYPFYKRDIESGECTEKQLRELVRDFLYKIYAMNTLANIPFYVCGPDESGKDTSNEFTYILLEEYRELDIIDPKIHIMYHPDVPQDILELTLNNGVDPMTREQTG